jgi:MFS family permease
VERARKRTRIAIDIAPLRASREYRLLWFGQLVSTCGTMLRFVAVPYHVYVLTDSPLAVGLIGLFQAGPLIAFSLWGGVVADAFDRRRLLLATQTGLAIVSVVLAVGTGAGVATVPFLYVMTAVGATLSALDGPARTSMIPALVGRELVPSAMALNQVLFQTASVAGPALGGVVLARFGLQTAYAIDAASYLAALLAVTLMRPPPRTSTGARPGWSSLVEGLRYLGGHKVILAMMALDFVAMFFGWPRSLFPFFADRVYDTGPQGLGLLFAAPGAGALAGALLAGWVSGVQRQGAAVLWCVLVWGAGIAAFGLLPANMFPLALFCLAAAGAADVFSAIFRGTILQLAVPDHLLGRLNSVNLMVVISGPRLGEVESGVVAELTSPRIAVVSGGIACAIGVIAVLVLVPSVVRYRAVRASDEQEDRGDHGGDDHEQDEPHRDLDASVVVAQVVPHDAGSLAPDSIPPVREVGRGTKVFDASPVRGRWLPLGSPEEVLAFMDEDPSDSVVVVVKDAGATFLAPIFEDLAAVICRSGTPKSHIGIVSREYQVPCVMATALDEEPRPGAEVEVDCSGEHGVVRVVGA